MPAWTRSVLQQVQLMLNNEFIVPTRQRGNAVSAHLPLPVNTGRLRPDGYPRWRVGTIKSLTDECLFVIIRAQIAVMPLSNVWTIGINLLI
jgi:hypothetical protein